MTTTMTMTTTYEQAYDAANATTTHPPSPPSLVRHTSGCYDHEGALDKARRKTRAPRWRQEASDGAGAAAAAQRGKKRATAGGARMSERASEINQRNHTEQRARSSSAERPMRLSLHRATASGLGIKGYVPRFRSFRSLFRSLRFLSIDRLSRRSQRLLARMDHGALIVFTIKQQQQQQQ